MLILFSLVLSGQNVTIKGKIKGAEGKTLCVYAWSDQITYTEKKIATGKIDSVGVFNFSFKIDETIFAYLKVDFARAPIYLEPGKTYNLAVSCPDCNSPDDKTNPYLAPKTLAAVISNSDSTELNFLINKFNTLYDDFVMKDFATIVKHRSKAKLDTFKLELSKQFSQVKNDYFLNLVKYRLAVIEESAQLRSAESLAKRYFKNKPVLYENTGYMEFFNEFFKNYITDESNYITLKDLHRTIDVVKTFPSLLDSLGKDTILKNEVLREMVVMKCLGELYYTKDYDKASILAMYKYVMENSKFPQHKIIAENYYNFFTKLAPGTTAPLFKLKDYNDVSYSLSEFNKDKYVYLFFWTKWCIPCITEMDLLRKFIDKYGTKVEFVGISCDKDFLSYYYFMQNKKYDFTTLHWGNNTELIENYNVKAYPTYVLIGPDGKIVQYPAEAPSGSLDALLNDLTKIKK